MRANIYWRARSSNLACIHVAYTPSRLDLTEMLAHRDQLVSSICPTRGFQIVFLSSHFYVVHTDTWTERNKPFSRCMDKHSQFGTLFPAIPFQNHLKLLVPRAILLMGARTHVFHVVPHDLELRPISGGGIVLDESSLLGTLIVVIPINLARRPFSIERNPILHHLLVLRVLEVWKSHPPLRRLSCVTRKIPAR